MAKLSSKRKLKKGQQRLIGDLDRLAAFLKKEWQNESDRGVVISNFSVIDETLYALLRKKLATPMTENDPLLDGPTAPIGSFYAKLLLAKSLGLISESLFQDLNTLRELRNAFAHNIRGASFSTPSVRQLITKFDHLYKGMVLPDVAPWERARFLAIILHFLAELHDKRSQIKKIRRAKLEYVYVEKIVANALGYEVIGILQKSDSSL